VDLFFSIWLYIIFACSIRIDLRFRFMPFCQVLGSQFFGSFPGKQNRLGHTLIKDKTAAIMKPVAKQNMANKILLCSSSNNAR